jgi:hypothetical protein
MAEEGFKRKLTAFRTSNLISLSFHLTNPNHFLKRRHGMKVIRIIAIILVSLSMGFILACGEEKTISIDGHEHKVALLEKLPKCVDNPETIRVIFLENAILKWQENTAEMIEFKGLNEIEKHFRDIGKNYRLIKLSISDVKEEADTAHVKYQITMKDRRSTLETKLNCSAEMVKHGQEWKIKEKIAKFARYG